MISKYNIEIKVDCGVENICVHYNIDVRCLFCTKNIYHLDYTYDIIDHFFIGYGW